MRIPRKISHKLADKFRKIPIKYLEWILIGTAALVFFTSLLSIHLSRPYTSDEVAIQEIAQSWNETDNNETYVSSDTWILKVPVYLLEDLISPANTRTKLFVSVLFFNAIFLFGLIYLSRYFLLRDNSTLSRRRLIAVYLPIVWFVAIAASLSGAFESSAQARSTVFINPNYRNAELGIAFIGIVVLAKFLKNQLPLDSAPRKIGLALLALFTGLFIYSDPYFLYTLIPALAVTSLVMWLAGSVGAKKLLATGTFLAASCASYILIDMIGRANNLFALNDSVSKQFTSLADIYTNLSVTTSSVFLMFNADLWGKELHGSLLLLINALLVGACLTAFIFGLIWAKPRLHPVRLSLLLCVILTTLAFCLTTNGNSIGNARYMILAVVCLLPLLSELLAWIASRKELQRLFVLLLLAGSVAVLINVGGSLRLVRNGLLSLDSTANDLNYRVTEIVTAEGLTKGYAEYWDADVNTYFSNSRIDFLPTLCGEDTLVQFKWMIDASKFDIPAKRTFYLSNKYALTSSCTSDQLRRIAGKPAKIIPVNTQYTLYIYDRDIGLHAPDYIPGVKTP